MQDFTIQTNNVCATQISFSLENGKLYNIKFKGGCPGNTQAISKLLEGADAQRTVELLKGNDCRGCPCRRGYAPKAETKSDANDGLRRAANGALGASSSKTWRKNGRCHRSIPCNRQGS